MGAIGGMLGLSGGISGTGQQITSAYTPEQLAASYGGTQQALAQQQALLDAIQKQQGLEKQSQVYQQLQDIAAGKGPTPAEAMLAQATGQNVEQQAALMAGQRGAGANVGLMARQASQRGADIQQQAAQQAAILKAQQQMGALGGAQQLATQQAQQQLAATGALTSGQLAQQQAIAEQRARENAARAGLAQAGMQQQSQAIGGLAQGVGAFLGMADGGVVPQSDGPQSSLGKFLQGQQPATLAMGGSVGHALKAGGSVPGHAQVEGDHSQNDTVHALLSPGEIVIPRSVVQSDNPTRGAADFVAAVLAKKGMRS